jgi:hypothetical protein
MKIISILPEFQSVNIHVELQPCSQNGEEQLPVSHTAAMEADDSISCALAPNLHIMPV